LQLRSTLALLRLFRHRPAIAPSQQLQPSKKA